MIKLTTIYALVVYQILQNLHNPFSLSKNSIIGINGDVTLRSSILYDDPYQRYVLLPHSGNLITLNERVYYQIHSMIISVRRLHINIYNRLTFYLKDKKLIPRIGLPLSLRKKDKICPIKFEYTG